MELKGRGYNKYEIGVLQLLQKGTSSKESQEAGFPCMAFESQGEANEGRPDWVQGKMMIRMNLKPSLL